MSLKPATNCQSSNKQTFDMIGRQHLPTRSSMIPGAFHARPTLSYGTLSLRYILSLSARTLKVTKAQLLGTTAEVVSLTSLFMPEHVARSRLILSGWTTDVRDPQQPAGAHRSSVAWNQPEATGTRPLERYCHDANLAVESPHAESQRGHGL